MDKKDSYGFGGSLVIWADCPKMAVIMKIAMMIDSWFPVIGGGPVHVLELSKRLIRNHGCDVDVYTRAVKHEGRKYEGEESLFDGRIRVIRTGPCVDFWSHVGRIKYLSLFIPGVRRYDIVHAHSYAGGIPARRMGKKTGVPVVFTVHGSGLAAWEYLSGGLTRLFKKKMEEMILLKLRYDHVISVSEEFAEVAREYHSRVTYIPNGIDVEKFSASGEKTNDLLFVGRLMPQKSLDTLIHAMRVVVAKNSSIKLRVVGCGPMEKDLRAMVDAFDLRKNIEFVQAEGDALTREYASSKIFVLPSVYEGFPLVILEAWASGLPVIGTDVSGTRELVKDRENGLLVPRRSSKELSDAIFYALDHPEEAAEWGRKGRELAGTFLWDTVAEKTFSVYRAEISR